jgi:hypothetical protein
MRALRNLSHALCTGYVACFFSERLFWTVLWPDATAGDLLLTWLAYSALAYLFLTVIHWSAADGWSSTFLAGSVYGWLAEGGLANTLYGGESSAPFPWSISITGLSWHTLLTIMVGWWGVRVALRVGRARQLAMICASVGMFWGFWSMFPLQEQPPIYTPTASFAVQAIGFSLALLLAWAAINKLGFDSFAPGWPGTLIALAAVGLFYVQHAAAQGWVVALLPLLVALSLGLLALNRKLRAQAATSAALASNRLLLWWLLTPLLATAVFAALKATGGEKLPIAPTLYLIAGTAGFVVYVLAAGREIRIAWRRPTAA